MSKETKIVIVLLAVWLYFHWAKLRAAHVTGLTGAAGNATPGYSTVGGDPWSGPGNLYSPRTNFRETWGSEYE